MSYAKSRQLFTAGMMGLALSTVSADASVVFTFTEVGSDVVMTSSGSLDTTKLVLGTYGGWGLTGFGVFGDYHMMGTDVGSGLNVSFTFSAGTDYSEWVGSAGPFGSNDFSFTVASGTKTFATYDNVAGYQPGIQLNSGDIVNGIWTPDQSWISFGTSFANLGLASGTFTVQDAVTNEAITYQIGSASPVPVPAALPLMLSALGLLGITARRRRS